jgi:hypothetical protein
VGASTFAAALAAAAAAVAGAAVLIDLDAMGGGIDVLLGIESVPGARWSGLRLDGGRLDPALLAGGLPRWGEVAVLAADVGPPSGPAVTAVLDAAARLGPRVLDLGRSPGVARTAALQRCDLTVLLAAADVAGLAAARAVTASLDGAPCGVVVRHGSLSSEQAAVLAGAPLLGELPAASARSERPLAGGRVPRAAARLAAGVLDGLSG